MNKSDDSTLSQVELKRRIERASIINSVDTKTTQFYNELNRLLDSRRELAKAILSNNISVGDHALDMFEEHNKRIRELLSL